MSIFKKTVAFDHRKCKANPDRQLVLAKAVRKAKRRKAGCKEKGPAFERLESRQMLFGDLDYALAIGDGVTGSALDAQSNIYLAGTFAATQDFDPGPAVFNMTANGIATFVVKLDANRNLIWAKQLDPSYGPDLALDLAGNIHLAGSFVGTVDLDPGPGTHSFSSNGAKDLWGVKISNEGNLIWARTFGGTGNDEAKALVLDDLGNVHVMGDFDSPTIDMDPGAGVELEINVGAINTFVLKLDPAGLYLWAGTTGGTTDVIGYDIEVDRFGSVYLATTFELMADFDPSGGTFNLDSMGETDACVAKWDSGGNFVWAASWGGSSFDFATAIALDETGALFVTGRFEESVDFDPSPLSAFTMSTSYVAAFISKLDTDGNFDWAKNFVDRSTQSWETGDAIAIDGRGSVYITGWFDGIVDLDPGPDEYILDAGTNGQDRFVVVLNQNGGFEWARHFHDNSGGNIGNVFRIPHLRLDSARNVYIAGQFLGPSGIIVGRDRVRRSGSRWLF